MLNELLLLLYFLLFWQTLSCRSKIQEGMIYFYQAKEDLCVSLRRRESGYFLSVLQRQKGFRSFTMYGILLVLFIFRNLLSIRFSFVTYHRPPVERCHALLCGLDTTICLRLYVGRV